MKGLLRDQPLVELISEISDAGHSGALRLARERVRGVVYAFDGRIVRATTNLRTHRLVETLRRWGGVAEERLEEFASKKLPDEQLAAQMMAAGLLKAEDAASLTARQSEEALRVMLLWADGEWAFDPRARLEGVAPASLDVGALLVEAARRLPAKFVASRMKDAETISPAARPTEFAQLRPEDAFVLSRVDSPVRLSDLLAVSGLPEAETRQAVYALSLGGLLRRERTERALPADPIAVKPGAMASAEMKATAEAQPVKEEPVAEVVAREEPDWRDEFETLMQRAGGKTHYSVLDVSRGARAEEIKSAYYALAKRFHPDRFRRDADEARMSRIEMAFTRIAQAYEVLKSQSSRATYDLKLDKEAAPRAPRTPARAPDARRDAGAQEAASQTPASAEQRAEDNFRQGRAAFERGELALATQHFAEAVKLCPRRAQYRGHYGRVLGRVRETRRQAEAELNTAIMLDARDVAYRVMLAEFYCDIGLRRRAAGELERALAVDPGHAAARRLLNTLRDAG